MRTVRHAIVTGLFLIALCPGIEVARTFGQGPGPPTSLGGYGASMTDAGTGRGSAIPYAGKFAGFMPFGMNGGGGLSFQPRGAPVMGSVRTPFSLSPAGGMSSMSAGIGRGLGVGPGMSSGFGPRGSMGSGGGMAPGRGIEPMPATRGMGVMPPSFAYPFRQPPSLMSPSASGTGMSM